MARSAGGNGPAGAPAQEYTVVPARQVVLLPDIFSTGMIAPVMMRMALPAGTVPTSTPPASRRHATRPDRLPVQNLR